MSSPQSCATLIKADLWVRPVQMSTIIEKTLQKLTSYGERKALSVYGWLQLHNGALQRLLQLLKRATGVIDDWQGGLGKPSNGQLQRVAAVLRSLVMEMPPSGHMGRSAFALAAQSQQNMTRFHHRVLTYLETSVGNAEARVDADARRHLCVLMVKCIEDGVPISARSASVNSGAGFIGHCTS